MHLCRISETVEVGGIPAAQKIIFDIQILIFSYAFRHIPTDMYRANAIFVKYRENKSTDFRETISQNS